jgi:PAS domain S-box-containing protein
VSPIKNAAGIVVGASKVARDITERRRIERALAHQREWFRVTLASIGDGVITADRDARVSFMNAVAEELTGWSAAEAEGRPLADVFRIEAEDGGPVLDPFGEVMRTREVVALANHTCLVARDGSRRSIADSAAPIIGADQQVIGVVLVFHDVSERRRLEQERQAAAAEREHLLESERVARGEAERASRLKDDFVATLSHELRTPLTAILGWAQILKRKASDADTVARRIAVIERNTRLQTQLISDLLDMSRIVSGKLRLEIQPSDLATVVDGVADTVRPAAEAKGIHIERMIQRGAKPVPVDAARLQQVIWNLLSNAIKFTPDGGQVAVRFTQDATHAEIAVDDSGIGIRDEFLPHLFGRFRQADASTSRRFGGLGLGLAIVKELVELHGGSVSASSAGEGLGARFVVRLPVRPRVPSVATLAEAVPDVPPASLTVLAGLRVLLVEDDGDTRELLGQLLRDAGLAVRAVSSAGEALESLASDPPDVIVSDISMPGEDGYTFMQRVRALEGQLGAVVPAIALTAFARDEDRSRAIRAGFQAHLAKPVDSAALLAVIGAVARVVPDAPVQ